MVSDENVMQVWAQLGNRHDAEREAVDRDGQISRPPISAAFERADPAWRLKAKTDGKSALG